MTPALRRRLEEEFQSRLDTERESIELTAVRKAERETGVTIKALKRRAEQAEEQVKKAMRSAEQNALKKMKEQVRDAVQVAAERDEEQIENLKRELQTERTRRKDDQVKMIAQVEAWKRKAEARRSSEIGEEAESDLYALLRDEFRDDEIFRIRHGAKGSDIVQTVKEGEREAGKIIYESKRTGGWNQAFVAQAKRYQLQYATPFVIIVSSAFPKKERDFCRSRGIPIVSPHLAVSLASIIREHILEIARLKPSGATASEKGRRLHEYIVSDRFETTFRGIAEAVIELKEEHRKERTWHENAWDRRSDLHDRLESRHREVNAHIGTILRDTAGKKPIQFAARAGQ